MRGLSLFLMVAVLVIAPVPLATAQSDPDSEPSSPVVKVDSDPESGPEEPESAPKLAPRGPTPILQNVVLKDGMLHVPGGRFTMGSTDKASPANEHPARQLVIPPFWIDKLEVSVRDYRACVARGSCARPPQTSSLCTFDMGDGELPISCVRWRDAQTYCTGNSKRLPREAEWELTARGTSPIRYPWGGSGVQCGAAVTLARENSDRSCSGHRPARVGVHLGGASPFGALDMSGNVEEWVEDWYAENVSEASPRAGASHVLRGGGWLSPPSAARTTSRNWGSVKEAGPNVGFRCARDDS